MSSDNLSQLVTLLSNLPKKLNDVGLKYLISQKANKISRLTSQTDPLQELAGLYQTLNDTRNAPLFKRQKLRKSIEQINILILTIMREQLEIPNLLTKKTKNSPVIIKKPKAKLFVAVAALGTILAALTGAAAIQSIFSAFLPVVTIPTGFIIASQIVFATTAVFAFYVFELNTIGKSLGIRPFDLGVLFKQYSEQSHNFKDSFRLIQRHFIACKNLAEYESVNKKYELLSSAYTSFQEKVKEAEIAKEPSRIKNIFRKTLTIFEAGIFGVLSALGAQPVLATFLPIVLGTTLATGPVGLTITVTAMTLCALVGGGLFVAMEKKGEKLINKLWGTPTKSINKLLARQEKIQNLIQDINISKINTLNFVKQKQPEETEITHYHPNVFDPPLFNRRSLEQKGRLKNENKIEIYDIQIDNRIPVK